MDLINALMNDDVSNEGPNRKRTRIESTTKNANKAPLLDSIRSRLLSTLEDTGQKILTKLDPEQQKVVEVEARIGMLLYDMPSRPTRFQAHLSKPAVNGDSGCYYLDENTRSHNTLHFQSGIDESMLSNVRNALKSQSFQCNTKPIEIIKTSKSGKRWRVSDDNSNNNSNKLPIGENKTLLNRMNLAMVSHFYDLRLNIGLENVVQITTADVNSWEEERIKRRESYWKEECPWRVDLTQVTKRSNSSNNNTSSSSSGSSSSSNSSSGGVEWELEFELDSSYLKKWIHNLKANTGNTTTTTTSKTPVVDSLLLTNELYKLIHSLIPSDKDPLYVPELRPVTDPHIKSEVMKLSQTIESAIYTNRGNNRGNNPNRSSGFIGAMPLPLNRRSLQKVVSHRYYATEKTDGVRYLLFVVKARGKVNSNGSSDSSGSSGDIAVLMNRSKEIFELPGCDAVGSWLKAGTVLDGELVLHRTQQTYPDQRTGKTHIINPQVFLAFDALAIPSNSSNSSNNNNNRGSGGNAPEVPFGNISISVVATLPFSQRKEKVKRCCDVFSHSWEACMRNITTYTPADVTFIIRKNFYEKTQISKLVSNIYSEEGGYVYREDSLRRHHKTDGIILQPDTPYRIGNDEGLLKWKWTELQSIDLSVNFSVSNDAQANIASTSTTNNVSTYPIPVGLSSEGPDGAEIDVTRKGSSWASMGFFDIARLRADSKALNNSRLHSHSNQSRYTNMSNSVQPSIPSIAECVYMPDLGLWRYLHLRKDKNRSNYIGTVLSVYVEQAEQISYFELQYILSQCNSTRYNGNTSAIMEGYRTYMLEVAQSLLSTRK